MARAKFPRWAAAVVIVSAASSLLASRDLLGRYSLSQVGTDAYYRERLPNDDAPDTDHHQAASSHAPFLDGSQRQYQLGRENATEVDTSSNNHDHNDGDGDGDVDERAAAVTTTGSSNTKIPEWTSNHISLEYARRFRIFPPPPPPSQETTRNNSGNSSSMEHASAQHAPSRPFLVDGTIVVRSSGEMGNALNHLAHARAVQLWAYEAHNMTTRLVLKPQILRGKYPNTGKTKSNERNIHQCFTHMKKWDFWQGWNDKKLKKRQALLVSSQHRDVVQPEVLELINSPTTNITDMKRALDHFHNLSTLHDWRRQAILDGEDNVSSWHDLGEAQRQYYLQEMADDPYPPPILEDNSMMMGKLMGRYYTQLRTFFAFDVNGERSFEGKDGKLETTTCCALLPDPDESVMHFRNYEAEIRNVVHQKGFEDLSAKQVANELFGHLQPGSKVAITTRLIPGRDNSAVDEIVHELKRRQMKVRVIGNQTGVQDFCFLMHAQKEIAGYARSTYFAWAGLLSNATLIRAYVVDSKSNRKSDVTNYLLRGLIGWGKDADPALLDRFNVTIYSKTAED